MNKKRQQELIEKMKYVTVLDFEAGRVFQYDIEVLDKDTKLEENEETIVYDGVEYIHRLNEDEDEPGEILLKGNMEVIGSYDGEDIEWISGKEWELELC